MRASTGSVTQRDYHPFFNFQKENKMRDKWSLLVISFPTFSPTFVSQTVIDFGSDRWADVAYDRIKETGSAALTIKVIKLY
jgi:hypothetical protein